jgi:hypothetical protein
VSDSNVTHIVYWYKMKCADLMWRNVLGLISKQECLDILAVDMASHNAYSETDQLAFLKCVYETQRSC